METKLQNPPNVEEAQFIDTSESKNLSVTKADESTIQKVGDNLNNIDSVLQKQPDNVVRKETELQERITKLMEINNNIIKRLAMSKYDKELLKIDSGANVEALRILRNGQNINLLAITEYSSRYLKTVLHNLTLLGETHITGTAKIQFQNAKRVFIEKLLTTINETSIFIETFQNQAKSRPEKFKNGLLIASDNALNSTWKDFDLHLAEFSELLKKTFSK